jgi:hypothetical protein
MWTSQTVNNAVSFITIQQTVEFFQAREKEENELFHPHMAKLFRLLS